MGNSNIKKLLYLSTLTVPFFLSSCASSKDDYAENQLMTLSFAFGDRTGEYTGHIENELPNGIGKFTSENENGEKWTYIGEWLNGHFEGKGTSWFDSGQITSADYHSDLASGFSLTLNEDGAIYYGNTIDDFLSGNGTYLSVHGCYEGQFSRGIFDGDGILYYEDGNVFDGTFKNGKIDGDGTFYLPNGEKITGIFTIENSMAKGKGIYYFLDGNSSNCTIENGEIHFSELSELENDNPTNTPTKIKHIDLKGRGHSDEGRSEPNYTNVFGYVAIGYSEEYPLAHSDSFSETPWKIPIYTKDKQFYIENGSVDHKTEVIVKSQELEHEGYGAYSGYLLVERCDTGDQFYINVSNFITKPYWTYDDLLSAVLVGYYVAEYNQQSDYYPVNRSGEKAELDNSTKVLVIERTGSFRGVDRNTNSIEAVVFKDWGYGYDGTSIYFNPQDLSIIY